MYCIISCRMPKTGMLRMYWFCVAIIFTEWIIRTFCRYDNLPSYRTCFLLNFSYTFSMIYRVTLIEMLILQFHVPQWVTGLFFFSFWLYKTLNVTIVFFFSFIGCRWSLLVYHNSQNLKRLGCESTIVLYSNTSPTYRVFSTTRVPICKMQHKLGSYSGTDLITGSWLSIVLDFVVGLKLLTKV